MFTPAQSTKPTKRKRGQAQKEVVRFIIEHKRLNNGNSPSYSQIADHMGYAYPMCAYNIVFGIVGKNRDKRPYLVDAGEYGWVWLDFDDSGRVIIPDGQFVIPLST